MAAAFQLLLESEDDRPRIKRPRKFRDRLNPLDGMTDDELIAKYRLSRACILDLLDTIGPELQRSTNRTFAIEPIVQIATALRFFATGSFQRECGDIHGLSKSSVSRCIGSVSRAISSRVRNYIMFPSEFEDLLRIKQDFNDINGFPNVIGAIDGTLIPIKGPSVDEPAYVCRKGFHALNVQIVCDAKLRLLNIVVKWPGSTHDSYVLNNSDLPVLMERMPNCGWLLGDSGYPLKPWLLTPVLNPSSRGEQKYNDSHCKTRVVVERCIGVWKSRFRCIDRSGGILQYEPRKCVDIISATAVLHQICINNNIPLPQEDGTQTAPVTDDNAAENVFQGEQSNDGRLVRQQLIQRKFTR